MKKPGRYLSYDLIRACACIFIILFHFSISGGRHLIFQDYIFRNVNLGSLGVSLFIILSGASLALSNKKISYFEFLKKRFLSIFPLFYIATFVFMVINFFAFPHIFDAVPSYRIIYTVLGFDGFLSYLIPTFNHVGEWYLGCIIILYLIYPILKKMIDKYPIIIFILLFIIYIGINIWYPFKMQQDRNPIVRLFEFSIGIYFTKYYLNNAKLDKLRWLRLLISFVVMVLTIYINNKLFILYNILLGGLATFVFLYELSYYIRGNFIKNIIFKISKNSYAAFLVHHQIVLLLSAWFVGHVFGRSRFFFIFIIYLFLIILFVIFIKKINSYIFNSLEYIKTSDSYKND